MILEQSKDKAAAWEFLKWLVGDAGQVYGLDLSAGMLQVSQNRLQSAGLAHWVKLLLGDAACLPFAPHVFDAILMSFALELLDTPEIPAVLAHCRTVLRDGGRLCAVALAKKTHDNLPVRLYEWAHARFPAVVDCRPIAVQQALGDAGFRILDVTELSMWGLPVEIVLAQNNSY